MQVPPLLQHGDPGSGSLKRRAQRMTWANALLTAVERGTVDGDSDGDWAAMSVLERMETAYDANARKQNAKAPR